MDCIPPSVWVMLIWREQVCPHSNFHFLLDTDLFPHPTAHLEPPLSRGFHELKVLLYLSREKNGKRISTTSSGGEEVTGFAFLGHVIFSASRLRGWSQGTSGRLCYLKVTGLYLAGGIDNIYFVSVAEWIGELHVLSSDGHHWHLCSFSFLCITFWKGQISQPL